jgi:hypothetical protein
MPKNGLILIEGASPIPFVFKHLIWHFTEISPSVQINQVYLPTTTFDYQYTVLALNQDPKFLGLLADPNYLAVGELKSANVSGSAIPIPGYDGWVICLQYGTK